MGTVRHHTILILAITLACVGIVQAETQYTNTPAVSARAMPFGGTVVADEVETPVSPLLAEAASTAGGNSGWAQATPGRLRASSVIVNASESWHNSQGVALFADHFNLQNAAMSPNSRGTFLYRFYLTGTMRIKASDLFASTLVNVAAYTIGGDDRAGQLNFRQVDGVATLYAESGGSMNPVDNILAGPNGDRRIYGTTTGQSGGYFQISIGIPVTFYFTNFPINTSPPVDDWQNLIDFRMSAVSLSDAGCDFSNTFEFAPQNPIVPDPDDPTLPVTGWDLDTASGEITLPPLLTMATSTGSGQAAFVAGLGTIDNLTALTLADFPEGLTGGNFAHGWFGMDVDLLDGGNICDVAITLPAAVEEGATWWFHDGVGWESIALGDDDGDSLVLLQVQDNGFGDADPAVGIVALAGGISDEEPLSSFFSFFEAEWQTSAVQLSWRAAGVDPASLRLVAHLDEATWEVPLAMDTEGFFTARDEAATLFGGGTVRYDLLLDNMLLDSKTVELPSLVSASLDMIAPNPFNPLVEIAYTLARDAGTIELTVHDLLGRRVATLVQGEPGPGHHVATWEGLDSNGQAAPSGVYLVRLQTWQLVQSRKISLVR